jgi:hypothetical protein
MAVPKVNLPNLQNPLARLPRTASRGGRLERPRAGRIHSPRLEKSAAYIGPYLTVDIGTFAWYKAGI